MSIQRTIFGVATPYQKQKYDYDLRLERAPDLSEQASRHHRDNIETLQAQYALDNEAMILEQAIALDVSKKRDIPSNTLLAKLEPLLPSFKDLAKKAEEGFDAWRDKQAVDDAKREIRLREITGKSQEVLEQTWTEPTIKKFQDNPELSGLLRSNLFSNDPGIQRRKGTAKVKLLTQGYDSMYDRWANNPNTQIEVHDGRGGTRFITPMQASTAAEAEAVLSSWDQFYRSYYSNDPEGIQQEGIDAVRAKRSKISQKLYKSVRSLASQRALGNWSQSLYAGMPMRTVLDGYAQTGDLKGGIGRVGNVEAQKLFLTDFKSGYKAGHFSYNNLLKWGAEPSGFFKNGKEQSMVERYPRLFSDMVNYVEETDRAITTNFFTNNKQKGKEITLGIAQMMSQGAVFEDEQLQRTTALLQSLGIVNDPILKAAFESNSVSALQQDQFEKFYQIKYSQGFAFKNEAEFHAAFQKFPELKAQFAAQDKANRAASPEQADENYKTALDAMLARSFEIAGDLDPKSARFAEGGGNLKQLPNGGAASSAGVIIQAELTKRFKYEVRRLMLNPIDGEEVIEGIGQTTKQNYYQLANDNTWQWFRRQQIKKGGRFEFTNGQYPNVNRLVQSPSTTLVITRDQQRKLDQGIGVVYNNFLEGVKNKYGLTGNSLGKAMRDPEMLSILYTETEKQEAIQRFERGEPPTSKTNAVLSFMGGNRFGNYQTLINTMAGKEVLSNRPGYEIYSQVQANIDLDPWLNQQMQGLSRGNPPSVNRTLARLQRVNPMPILTQATVDDPEAEAAARAGAAGGPPGSMAESTTGAAEGMQGNEGMVTGQVEINNKVYARVQQLIEDLLPKYKGDYQQAIAEAQRLWREATGNPNFTIE